MTTLKARPTVYKGIRMRSRLEATYAAFLDRSEDPWVYEPCCFASEAGQYLPDFRIDDLRPGTGEPSRWYIEVKPAYLLAYPDKVEAVQRRMEIVWASEPDAGLLLDFPMRGERFFRVQPMDEWFHRSFWTAEERAKAEWSDRRTASGRGAF